MAELVVNSGDITAGDYLKTRDGQWVRVEEVRINGTAVIISTELGLGLFSVKRSQNLRIFRSVGENFTTNPDFQGEKL